MADCDVGVPVMVIAVSPGRSIDEIIMLIEMLASQMAG